MNNKIQKKATPAGRFFARNMLLPELSKYVELK